MKKCTSKGCIFHLNFPRMTWDSNCNRTNTVGRLAGNESKGAQPMVPIQTCMLYFGWVFTGDENALSVAMSCSWTDCPPEECLKMLVCPKILNKKAIEKWGESWAPRPSYYRSSSAGSCHHRWSAWPLAFLLLNIQRESVIRTDGR